MKLKTCFLVFDGALGLDITGPLEVFHTVNRLLSERGLSDDGYDFHFIARDKGVIQLSSGLELMANTDFSMTIAPDMLIVPGGRQIRLLGQNPEYLSAVGNLVRRAKRLVSVCEGVFLLAQTGLIDGKRVTTHWASALDLAECFPSLCVESDAIFIKDGHLFTSAGVTAGIDLALAIVEEDFGLSMAMETARLLVLYYRRPGYQNQFSFPLYYQAKAGKRFTELHDWLISHLNLDITVYMMAEKALMSERHFARVFKEETGETPNKYLENIRLDRSRELMDNGNEPLEQIAEMCGFGREERFRRAFYRRFGITPSQYRLHFSRDLSVE